MLAACRERYVALSELRVKELPRPVPGENEMLIRVHATTVNRTDCAVLTGRPFIMRLFTGLFRPKRVVPGTDFAGIVVAVGSKVNRFKTGDRVWGFNDQGLGTQAQFATVDQKQPVSHIPEGLSFSDAVACAEGAHYAVNFLNKVTLTAGQRVMINGATGAIGSALLQLIKARGAFITATCQTQHLEMIRSMGADVVIDYTREDFTQQEGTFDFVFDAVGKSTFGKCKRLLTRRGIYISSELGPGAQNIFLALFTPLFRRRKVVFPIPSNIPASLAVIKQEVEQGRFRPLIDRHYPLAQISEAYLYAASGKKTGNVVIDMPAD